MRAMSLAARCGDGRQTFYHQRAQVVFQNDILKITMKLRDGGSGAGHGHQLSGMLGQEGVIQGIHR